MFINKYIHYNSDMSTTEQIKQELSETIALAKAEANGKLRRASISDSRVSLLTALQSDKVEELELMRLAQNFAQKVRNFHKSDSK